jgi:hypothetical protein
LWEGIECFVSEEGMVAPRAEETRRKMVEMEYFMVIRKVERCRRRQFLKNVN